MTGAWPLIHMKSFELFTGPKVDKWLVKMVGLLALSAGVVLVSAGRRKAVTRETKLLGASFAISFAAVDLGYTFKGRIPRTYLVPRHRGDAAIELPLATAWLLRNCEGISGLSSCRGARLARRKSEVILPRISRFCNDARRDAPARN